MHAPVIRKCVVPSPFADRTSTPKLTSHLNVLAVQPVMVPHGVPHALQRPAELWSGVPLRWLL